MDNFKTILLSEIDKFRVIGQSFKNKEINAAEFKKHSGGMGVYAHRGGNEFMVRLRIPSGITNVRELKLVYDFAKKYNLEGVHLTTRQAIQLHGMDIDEICDLMRDAIDLNIFTRGAGGNFPRNVALSPLSGVDKEEVFDVTPYALAVGNHFLRKIYTYKLPRKFKVSFSSSYKDEGHCTIQDLGFMAINKDGKDMFKVYAGGGLGMNPRKAIVIEEAIEPKEVLYYVEAMTNFFINEGDYNNKARARIRYLVEKLGEDVFRDKLKDYVAVEKEKSELELHLHPQLINKAGISIDTEDKRLVEQKQEGLYSVYVHPLGGQLKLSQLKTIIDLVDTMEDIDIRLTMTEGLYIRNLNGEEAKKVLEGTKDMTLKTRIDASVSCIGIPVCQMGRCNSQGLLQNIIEYFNKEGYTSDVLPRVHISGCPNSCAVHEIGEIGFMGIKKMVEGKPSDALQLFVGGEVEEGKTVLAETLGDFLPERIPEFLYELSKKVEASGIEFHRYIQDKEEELQAFIDEYKVV